MRFWPWMHQQKPEQASDEYALYDAYSKLLERNGRWIEVADVKAGALLVFLTALFPALSSTPLSIISDLIHALPKKPVFSNFLPICILVALSVAFAIFALHTLICVLRVLRPRVSRERSSGDLFFGDVAAEKYEVWQQRMFKLDASALAVEVLEQVYVTACISAIKHKYVQKAIYWIFWTVPTGLLLFVASHVIG